MKIIRRDLAAGGEGEVVDDDWRTVADDEVMPPSGDVIVGLSRFDEAVAGGRRRVGIRIAGDTEIDAFAPHLSSIALLAIEIPKLSDGRAYSLARLLRDRHGYRGELRAVGHVFREQLLYLARCGFDAFVLAPGKDLEDALSAFGELPVRYQPGADDEPPIWKRRAGTS
jgi:uncharacterized protein (DUF934 family)